MPRLGTGSELFKYLNSVKKYTIQTSSGGDTTTTEAIVAGDTAFDVTATTNFTTGDYAMVDGSGGTELVKLGTVASTMPVTRPMIIAQNTGARLVEAVEADLGHVAEGGIQFGGSATITEIKAATSRTAIAFIADAAILTWTIPLLGYNNLNLLAAFGATESEAGSGSAAAPYAALIGQDTVNTQTLFCLRATGVRHDSKIVEVDFLDCTVEVNVNVTIGAPNPDGITMTGKCASIIQRIWTPA